MVLGNQGHLVSALLQRDEVKEEPQARLESVRTGAGQAPLRMALLPAFLQKLGGRCHCGLLNHESVA